LINWLLENRQEQKMTQSEIAKKSFITQAHYANIENGKRRPSPEVAKAIAEVLGFHWTRFYEEEKAANQAS